MAARKKSLGFTLLALALAVLPVFAQFLPRPPRDPRPDQARAAFDGGRYREAAELFEEYLVQNPENAEGWLFLGWSRYRLGEFSLATRHFGRSLEVEPNSVDARVGLGYSFLQTVGAATAATEFLRALEKDARRGDALRGLVLAGRRPDAPEWVIRESVKAARKLEALEGKDVETLISSETLRAGTEKRLRPRVGDEVPLRVPWRAGDDYLELATPGGDWQPVFIKGVNLSVTLPGRFPSDQPTDERAYRDWIASIAGMGANALRVYTLLPPAFYRALAHHNRIADRRLWLIQGIWFDLPPANDFDDQTYRREIELEIARVVDAVHGNLAIGPRPGQAWGAFDEDVSPFLISFVLGRNWEPFVVEKFNERRRSVSTWEGEWFRVEDGQAMESWVASLCDYTTAYQVRRYRTLHPITFANWPSLDPIDHPTESSRAEENEWRTRAGMQPIPDHGTAWEDDVVSIDATRILPTDQNTAGIYASYQIYPSFPDFMNHQYGTGSDPDRSYGRYLSELKSYHGRQPVLVIEFGISTSRGIAHTHTGSLHHGGHDERTQGRLLAQQLQEIFDHDFAGGIIFSFMDEWSRTTWNTAAFEIPSERGYLWFNAQSPDQSFGLVRQAPASSPIRIDGIAHDWSEVPPYSED